MMHKLNNHKKYYYSPMNKKTGDKQLIIYLFEKMTTLKENSSVELLNEQRIASL
jgi:hypothetical protein